MEQGLFLKSAVKYKDTIFRIAFNYFGNTYDAEDALQDVLLKLYTCKKEFLSEEHLRNWLIRISINVCKNTLRLPWHKKRFDMEELPETAVFNNPEEESLLSDVMRLPEKYRTVLYLYYYEEFSVKEIATFLKVKPSAITTRLLRARKLLKEAITGDNRVCYKEGGAHDISPVVRKSI